MPLKPPKKSTRIAGDTPPTPGRITYPKGTFTETKDDPPPFDPLGKIFQFIGGGEYQTPQQRYENIRGTGLDPLAYWNMLPDAGKVALTILNPGVGLSMRMTEAQYGSTSPQPFTPSQSYRPTYRPTYQQPQSPSTATFTPSSFSSVNNVPAPTIPNPDKVQPVLPPGNANNNPGGWYWTRNKQGKLVKILNSNRRRREG